MKLMSLHLILSGRVQGVGFRYFVLEEARALRLTGYVKNLAGGEVEVLAEGPEESLTVFFREVKQGPSLSRVTGVREEWTDRAVRAYSEFRINH